MGVREQNKAHTRTTLANVAVRLFTERGYDNVTMADVADEAGVSRRTAFRYFPSKDDLVMYHPAEWLAVFDKSLEAHHDRPLVDRLSMAADAVADRIEENPVAVRQLFGLAFVHPSLAGRYAVSSRLWIERITVDIHRDVANEDDARMLAAALMGVINTVGETWAASEQPMRPLLERGLQLITPSLSTAVKRF